MPRRNARQYSTSLSLNDLLFNVLLGFVLLFIIAFLLIQPPTKTGDIPAKAEVMIIMEWPENSAWDIDLWAQQDDFPAVGYSNKDEQALHLDRDDLGDKNDVVMINGKREVIKGNREIVTLRGIVAGDYFIGVHAYNMEEEDLTVTVTAFDVNPYREIYRREVTLQRRGDKVNLPGFTMDEEGNVVDIWNHNRNLGPRQRSGEYDDAVLRQQLNQVH